MDLQKRNRVIAAYKQRGGISANALLTPEDMALVETARAMNLPWVRPYTNHDGDLVYDLGAVVEIYKKLGPKISIGPLLFRPHHFADIPPADAYAELISLNRKHERSLIVTIPIADFFDGNSDTNCFGNMPVDFSVARETLLSIAARPDVLAVGVSVNELPNVENEADDEAWIAAEEVFFWSSMPLKILRPLCNALQPSWLKKTAARNIMPSDAIKLPPKSVVSRLGWD